MRPRTRPGLSADLAVLAEAVIGAAAAQPVHREISASWLDVRRNAVVDAAREFYRTGGQNYDELMTAVRDLEQAIDLDDRTPPSCYCGTGLEHERGQGYHCGKAQADG